MYQGLLSFFLLFTSHFLMIIRQFTTNISTSKYVSEFKKVIKKTHRAYKSIRLTNSPFGTVTHVSMFTVTIYLFYMPRSIVQKKKVFLKQIDDNGVCTRPSSSI